MDAEHDICVCTIANDILSDPTTNSSFFQLNIIRNKFRAINSKKMSMKKLAWTSQARRVLNTRLMYLILN